MAFASLDYNLLIVFTGLFVVSGSFVSTGIPKRIWMYVTGASDAFGSFRSTALICVYSIIVSQLVGNVALVIMVGGEVRVLEENKQKFGWLVLSWVSTLAGNFTLKRP